MANVSQYSTTAANNNSTPPDGAPEGMAPSTVNDTIREIMAGLAKWYSDTDGTLATAGSSNAFTITTNSTHAALGDQSIIVARADRAPTGAATLAVDGLAAKSIKVNHDEDVTSSTWEANQMLIFVYNATDDVYEVIGPNIVGDGTVTTAKLADGAVTTAKVTSVPFPRGHLAGCQMSQDIDADHDIAIAVGTARDSTDAFNFSLSSVLTKQIDASWAAGDDAGGMANGVSLSPSGWYHVFLVDDGSGNTDAGFDTDISATNLLATSGVGTFFRRIGSVLTDSSSNIIAFTQSGNLMIWTSPPLDIDDTSTGATAKTSNLSVPPGVRTRATLNITVSTNVAVYISATDQTDQPPAVPSSAPLGTLFDAGGNSAGTVSVISDTSSQIRYRTSLSGSFRASTLYYEDDRGVFD